MDPQIISLAVEAPLLGLFIGLAIRLIVYYGKGKG